jgi:hypothetical protein
MRRPHRNRHSFSYPLCDVDAYGVSKHPEANGVDESRRPAVRETLEAFALGGSKAADGRAGGDDIATVIVAGGYINNQGFRAAAQIATARAESAATLAVSTEGRLRKTDGLIPNVGNPAYSGAMPADRSNATFKRGGRLFLRLAARWRMPAQALGEREYFGAAFGSRIETRETAEEPSAALGHSEPLSIKHAPRSRIPETLHFTEDESEVAPASGSK